MILGILNPPTGIRKHLSKSESDSPFPFQSLITIPSPIKLLRSHLGLHITFTLVQYVVQEITSTQTDANVNQER